MLYFVLQTVFLAALVFIMGLFVGIFLKNMLCKQGLQVASTRCALKQRGRRHMSHSRMQHQQDDADSSFYAVKPSESAALAKKRTAALVQQRGRAAIN